MYRHKIKEVKKGWELLKQFIVFHPQQFFTKLDDIEEQGLDRIVGIVWDDAGLWLYALDWNDPFIEAFGKYLNIARSHLGCLICTTPLPLWIFKKLRNFPQATNIRIMKCTGNPYQKYRRLARAYSHWMAPDMKKSGVRKIYEDFFDCRMPNHFFEWYQPLRNGYENMARELMRERWK